MAFKCEFDWLANTEFRLIHQIVFHFHFAWVWWCPKVIYENTWYSKCYPSMLWGYKFLVIQTTPYNTIYGHAIRCGFLWQKREDQLLLNHLLVLYVNHTNRDAQCRVKLVNNTYTVVELTHCQFFSFTTKNWGYSEPIGTLLQNG